MKFIDLFSGIGGFRLAFESAGYQCVFSCEIDKECQFVYKKNFGEQSFHDITQLNPERLPDFQVLTAGFPCQPFSICGKRLGFEDTRGTLFFDICRIIEAKQPAVVILENVKFLIHHDQGRTLKTICQTLQDFGYKVSQSLLNAKDFGVPQHRERIFIIAAKTGYFDFAAMKKTKLLTVKAILDQTGDFEFLDKSEYTLIRKPILQKSGLIFVGYRNKGTWKTGVRPNTEHLSRVHRQPNRIYSIEGVHPTLPSQESSGRFWIYNPDTDRVRKLTLNECYRLNGFPEDFKKHPVKSVCYLQNGNSVCIPLVTEIARSIKAQGLLTTHGSQRHTQTNVQLSLFS